MDPSFFIAQTTGADGMAGMRAAAAIAAVLESEGFGGNPEPEPGPGPGPGAEPGPEAFTFPLPLSFLLLITDIPTFSPTPCTPSTTATRLPLLLEL